MNHVLFFVRDLDAGTAFRSALQAAGFAFGCRDHGAADSNPACVLDALGNDLGAVRRGA